MNLSSLRQRAVTIPRQDAFVGTWQAIFWQPDLFSPQRFVVGTLAVSQHGETAFRLMDTPGRIECFFRPNPIRREFAALMAMVKRAIANSEAEIDLGSPNFSLGSASFARGDSAQSVANSTFCDAVTASRAMPGGEDEASFGLDTEQTRQEVGRYLKQFLGLRYERVAREQGQTLSDHFLDVSLAPDGGAGSVISACFKSPQTVEMKILRAATDINTYAGSQHRQHKALFILEAGEQAPLSPKDRKTIDDLIGNECWKLEQAGFTVPTSTNTLDLANYVREWALPLVGN